MDATCPDCPDCAVEMNPFINAIPSTGDDVGYQCPSCGSRWTHNEWQNKEGA